MKKFIYLIIICLLSLFTSGCVYREATIVDHGTYTINSVKCPTTIFEFRNGARVEKYGNYGNIGEKYFIAQ